MFERIIRENQDYKFSDSVYGVHRKIIQYVGRDKKVLDVGCGSGYLGEAFKENGCYVVGIESDCDRAKIAQGILDTLIINDVENIGSLSFPDYFFDVIIFADVLEHLKRPDTVLIQLKKYLNKNGYIVISVPNIARIDMRLKLFFGNFNYENGGIVDKTHLRFFTKKTACKLLKECGYSIIKIDYGGFFSRRGILEFLSNLLAFQFIFLARPN